MTVKIRLARGGSKKRPFYNIVVIDSRKKRDGKPIEYLGFVDPMVHEETAQRKKIKVEIEKIEAWIKNGAVVTESLARKMKAFNIKGMDKFIPPNKTEYVGISKKDKKADVERKIAEEKVLAKAKADGKASGTT